MKTLTPEGHTRPFSRLPSLGDPIRKLRSFSAHQIGPRTIPSNAPITRTNQPVDRPTLTRPYCYYIRRGFRGPPPKPGPKRICSHFKIGTNQPTKSARQATKIRFQLCNIAAVDPLRSRLRRKRLRICPFKGVLTVFFSN